LEPQPPGDGAQPGRERRRRGVGVEPGQQSRLDPGGPGRPDGRRVGTAALWAEDHGPHWTPAAGPRRDPHRTAPRRRDAGAAAPEIPPAASRRLSVFRLPPALPRLARAAAPVDASGAQGRREALRRLLRKKPEIVDQTSGIVRADFIQSQSRALEYLRGV